MFSLNAASSLRGTVVANEKRVPRTSRAFLRARKPAIETLEARQLLSLSVSARTLFGPSLALGASTRYKSYDVSFNNGTIAENDSETSNQFVDGTTEFNGAPAVEIVSVAKASADGTTSVTTDDSFFALTSSGFLDYGGTSIQDTPGETSLKTTTVNRPPEVEFPEMMVAGTPYSEYTTSTATTTIPTTIPNSSSTTTTVTLQSADLTLESAKHLVRVPAGKFKAYVVDESITDSSTSTTTFTDGSPPITNESGPPSTFTAHAYYAPRAGLVDYVVGSSDTVLEGFSAPKGKRKG